MRDRSIHYYERMFRTIQVLPEKDDLVRQAGEKVLQQRSLYEAVQAATGVPWVFVGLIHLMESGCEPLCQIYNGQRWDRKTTIHPSGRGPWADWPTAAIDALKRMGMLGLYWSIALILRRLEQWNGWGYGKKGLDSDYLVGLSDWDDPGKYVADGSYDVTADTKQVGAALVLRWLHDNGHWMMEEENLLA
jgi:lysozyme family protein